MFNVSIVNRVSWSYIGEYPYVVEKKGLDMADGAIVVKSSPATPCHMGPIFKMV
ncbi:hypothetical protein SAMN04488514_106193 [Kriegella aquimaris]|uniref:Uncharacterized protein n=1 Tax=Kriegella aquimaris TaxID=192904 RepID=A0A1G9RLH4_9FLAO|nr:hypothetical protein SAMN04488514_106193 [Kriegella aquimaris]